MKKKIILTTITSVFLSLVSLLVAAILLLNGIKNADAERSLKNYLSLAEEFYDADDSLRSPDATVSLLKTGYSDVRLTIISEDGVVKKDTEGDLSENHLTRPEIVTPGTIVHRYSTTLQKNMIYLAGVDQGSKGTQDYVRVALSVDEVESGVRSLALWGSLISLGITACSGGIAYFVVGKEMKPLQENIAHLSTILGEESSPHPDVDELSSRVERTRKALDERYYEIQQEKKKYEDLINQLDQGLVAVDHHGRIQLLNEVAARSFGVERSKALGESYLYLCNDSRFSEAVNQALQGKAVKPFDLTWQEKIYLINISALEGDLHEVPDVYGASILCLDVTEKRKLDAAKRDFFANASHELKSPLTSIIGIITTRLFRTLSSPDEVQDANQRVLKEAERMQGIITSMLTLSKLEGASPREKIALDLKPLVEECLLSKEKAIEQKQLVVKTSLKSLVVMMAKEDATNLVGNLIDNAIKYNKEKGSLVLTLGTDFFEVQDTGIGIKEEDQSRIYERFFRAQGSQGEEGSGLGLSIVKHLVLDYGLSLTLKSQYGLGSTFRLVFPSSLAKSIPSPLKKE